MAANTHPARSGGNLFSIAIWGLASLMLLLPLIAMQLTDEVNWDGTDFAVFGTMLLLACGACELAARMSGNLAWRAAVVVAVGNAFLLVWINLAVGFIGAEDHPANLLFAGVLAVGLASAVVVGFRPAGMSRAMLATAATQALVAAVALAIGYPLSAILTLLFAAPWLLAAWLFLRAERSQAAGATRG